MLSQSRRSEERAFARRPECIAEAKAKAKAKAKLGSKGAPASCKCAGRPVRAGRGEELSGSGTGSLSLSLSLSLALARCKTLRSVVVGAADLSSSLLIPLPRHGAVRRGAASSEWRGVSGSSAKANRMRMDDFGLDLEQYYRAVPEELAFAFGGAQPPSHESHESRVTSHAASAKLSGKAKGAFRAIAL